MDARPIFVVSDSTGETAERVVRAALLQFPDQKARARIRLFTRVRSQPAVEDVIRRAAEAGAMVVYTLVASDLRQFCSDSARERDVEAVDIIGALIGNLAGFLGAAPLNAPTASQPLSAEYFRRVEAIEFAVKSDDGKEPRNLHKADLVLVGVSRTSKTPLSTYLAGRGLKVANVPLVMGVEPPAELAEIPRDKVVALTIDVEHLLEIRLARLRQLGMPHDTNYGMREHVEEELEMAADLFGSHGWLVIDVSGRAIEETATIILEQYKDRDDLKNSIAPPFVAY